MIDPVASPYLVPFDGSLKIANTQTAPDKKGKKKALKAELGEMVKRLSDLQEVLYAHNRYSLLMVFQAMDAAGKDSTIRAVLSGVNPAGCQVFSFKQPSKEEYDHDFLWRTSLRLPERGRIGVFNRSHYESVLVVKVHPEYLGSEQLPEPIAKRKNLFQERYASIRDHEQHLARNGTVILKFFLNVGRDEQKARFLKRLNDPSKNWKFAAGDLAERALWPKYMDAYQDALNETSRPCAPWYAIPADDKPSMRLQVATIAVEALSKLDMGFPTLGKKDTAALGAYKARLEAGE
ncbi:MAG: polyphosphate kinase 2 family protein [Planctomycetes bacterium]|nr:polyphosphate kinase 2 family protein [Planctomycetota bacterium]